jgi:hypothetical protein
MALPEKDIERQLKLEADAVHDGIVRYAQSREYQLATDSKPVRDMVGDYLKPLAAAILAEQLALKRPELQLLCPILIVIELSRQLQRDARRFGFDS